MNEASAPGVEEDKARQPPARGPAGGQEGQSTVGNKEAIRAAARAARAKQPYSYCYVTCHLNKKRVPYCLVDSGAVTTITYSLLCQLVKEPKLEKQFDNFRQFGGIELRELGTVKLKLEVGNYCNDECLCVVVDDAPASFVIGGDLLSLMKDTRFDWENQLAWLGSDQPVPFHAPNDRLWAAHAAALDAQKQGVFVLHRQQLKPWSGVWVQVLQPGRASPGNWHRDFEFEPDRELSATSSRSDAQRHLELRGVCVYMGRESQRPTRGAVSWRLRRLSFASGGGSASCAGV